MEHSVSAKDGNPVTKQLSSVSALNKTENGHTESDDNVESDNSDNIDDDSDDAVLRKAGVKMQLSEIQGLQQASLTLLTEFVNCCVAEKYTAAEILCKRILALEPANQIALQFLPVLEERLRLDVELSTESSSEEDQEITTDTDSSTSDGPTPEATPNKPNSTNHIPPSSHSRNCKHY